MERTKIIIPIGMEIPKGYKPILDSDNVFVAIVPEDTARMQCLNTPHTIDWEQRRYEIAKAVLPGVCAGALYERGKPITGSCDFAIQIADELIKQLEESKQ